VAVSFQVQRPQVLEGRRRRTRVQGALPNVTPERLRDLDVGEMRDVEGQRGIGDPGELVTGSRPSDAIQAVFSDGLARVSVFIEKHDPARQRQPLMTQMGATHTLMRQRHDRWWITVMGDVPPMTLKQFLAALERRP